MPRDQQSSSTNFFVHSHSAHRSIFRTSLIFVGGLTPLLYEISQFRCFVSQLFDQTSTQVVLRAARNSELLHHDITVRLGINDFSLHMGNTPPIILAEASTMGTRAGYPRTSSERNFWEPSLRQCDVRNDHPFPFTSFADGVCRADQILAQWPNSSNSRRPSLFLRVLPDKKFARPSGNEEEGLYGSVQRVYQLSAAVCDVSAFTDALKDSVRVCGTKTGLEELRYRRSYFNASLSESDAEHENDTATESRGTPTRTRQPAAFRGNGDDDNCETPLCKRNNMGTVVFTASVPEDVIVTPLAFRVMIILCILSRWFSAELRMLTEAFFTSVEAEYSVITGYQLIPLRRRSSTALFQRLSYFGLCNSVLPNHYGEGGDTSSDDTVLPRRETEPPLMNSVGRYHQTEACVCALRNPLCRTVSFCVEYLRSLATVIFLHTLSCDGSPVLYWTPLGSISPDHLVTLQYLAWLSYAATLRRTGLTLKGFSEWSVTAVWWGLLDCILFIMGYVCRGCTSAIAFTFLYHGITRKWIWASCVHMLVLLAEAAVRVALKLEHQTTADRMSIGPHRMTARDSFSDDVASSQILMIGRNDEDSEILTQLRSPEDTMLSLVEHRRYEVLNPEFLNVQSAALSLPPTVTYELDRLDRQNTESEACVTHLSNTILPQFSINWHQWLFSPGSLPPRLQLSGAPIFIRPTAHSLTGQTSGNTTLLPKRSLIYLVERIGLHLYRVRAPVLDETLRSLNIMDINVAQHVEANEVREVEKPVKETSKHFNLGDQPLCYICMGRLDNAVMLPCMHGGLCLLCGHAVLSSASLRLRFPRCPLCRRPVRALGQLRDFSLPSPLTDDSGRSPPAVYSLGRLKCQLLYVRFLVCGPNEYTWFLVQ